MPLPLKKKAEVREATRSPRIFASTLSSSSDSPSAKYSFSSSRLMFTNGRTAIEGVSLADVAAERGAADEGAGVPARPPSRRSARSANAAGVSGPKGRDHCSSRNRSGTRAVPSAVSSIATGSRNAWSSAMRCERSTASFHSNRK
jgi:hypothetical protein